MHSPSSPLVAALAAAWTAALAGGAVIRTAFSARDDGLDPTAAGKSSPHDLVTATDRAAERAIVAVLRARDPGANVLGEEGGADAGAPPWAAEAADFDPPWWVIDPLDGTLNFAHGHPHHAVSIGRWRRGAGGAHPEVGVVLDPQRDEAFATVRGAGAWLVRRASEPGALDGLLAAIAPAGAIAREPASQALVPAALATADSGVRVRRLQVRVAAEWSTSLLATGFPVGPARTDNLAAFAAIRPEIAGIRRAGSAALDLAYVAAGRLDGYWEFGLQPWDTAAGALLVLEAGGLVRCCGTPPAGGRAPLAPVVPWHPGAPSVVAGPAAVVAALDERLRRVIATLTAAATSEAAP